jgi:hypothetical protein
LSEFYFKFVSDPDLAKSFDSDRIRIRIHISTDIEIYIFTRAGFGDDLLKEERTIEDLVNVLKNEIRYVHVFVLAFRQTDNRMTYALRSMISLFEKGITTGQFLVYWVLAKKKE